MSTAEKTAPSPAVVWISPGGECSDTPREGWERVEINDPMPPGTPEQEVGGVRIIRHDPADDRALLESYAEQLTRIDAASEGIRAGYARLREVLAAQEAAALRPGRQLRAYLEWAHGHAVRAIVDALRGKRKYVDTTYARLGWRKSRDRVEVRDETAALVWAAEHAPEAIVQPDPYLRKSDLPVEEVRAGRVHGVEFVAGVDEFYVGCAPKARGGES